MLVTTKKNIPCYKVTDSKRQMFGIAARSSGLGGNITADLLSPVEGGITGYVHFLKEVYLHTVDRMLKNAATLHANTIVIRRFDCSEISNARIGIVAYGTAVVQEKQQ